MDNGNYSSNGGRGGRNASCLPGSEGCFASKLLKTFNNFRTAAQAMSPSDWEMQSYNYLISGNYINIRRIAHFKAVRRYEITFPSQFLLPSFGTFVKCKHFMDPILMDVERFSDFRVEAVRRLYVIFSITDATVQMDSKQTLGGEAEASSSVASNTIITETQKVSPDGTDAKNVPINLLRESGRLASTEKGHSFKSIMNRWVPIKAITLDSNTAAGDSVFNFEFPRDFLADPCVANLLPFQNFSYCVLKVEFKLVVNSQRFQAGLLNLNIVYDPATLRAGNVAGGTYANLQSFISREHSAFIDISTQTDVTMQIPWRFHRNSIRGMSGRSDHRGVIPGVFAAVQVVVVSPLNVPAGGSQSAVLLPFYRIADAEFYGMGPTKPLRKIAWNSVDLRFHEQSPLKKVADITDVVVDTGGKFSNFVRDLDRGITRVGDIVGLDKPIDLESKHIFVPRPRHNFLSGVGPCDAIPLRTNPSTATSYMPHHRHQVEVSDIRDIMTRWGFLSSLPWRTTFSQGLQLFRIPLEPAYLSIYATQGLTGVAVSPLETFASTYGFWSGTMEVQFMVVCTGFHSGAFTVSLEYDVESTSVDSNCSYACYTKTCDIGTQRIFNVTIPYIYDTSTRRTGISAMWPMYDNEDSTPIQHSPAIMMTPDAFLVVRVANPLRCVENVATTVQIVTLVRAGKDFELHAVLSSTKVPMEHGKVVPDSFPFNYAPTTEVGVENNVMAMRNFQISRKALIHAGRSTTETLSRRTTVSTSGTTGSHSTATTSTPSTSRGAVTGGTTKKKPWSKVGRSIPEGTGEVLHAVVDAVVPTTASNGWVQAVVRYGSTAPLKMISRDILPSDPAYGVEVAKYEAAGQFPRYYWYNVDHHTRHELQPGSVPAEQMKPPGEQDDTADFRTGSGFMRSLTSDNQHNINWVMRRPLMICSGIGIPALDGTSHCWNVFHLPLMPPQDDLAQPFNTTILEADESFRIVPSIIRSPHAVITRMFRMWRGSMNYTIVARTSTNAPIYISCMPHNGARMFGSEWDKGYRTSSGGGVVVGTNPATLGLPTVMLMPTVNPTETVQVPYESENEWTLMHEFEINQAYQWKEKGDYNAGHLLIWSAESQVIDIFWAAGDDFRLSAYIGLKTTMHNYVLPDDNHAGNQPIVTSLKGAHAQMYGITSGEFTPMATRVAGVVGGVVSRVSESTLGSVAAVVAGGWLHPSVGTALSGVFAMERVAKISNDLSSKGNHIVGDAHNIANNIERGIRAVEGMSLKAGMGVDKLSSSLDVLEGEVHGVTSRFNNLATVAEGTAQSVLTHLEEFVSQIVERFGYEMDHTVQMTIVNSFFDVIMIASQGGSNIAAGLAVAVARALVNFGFFTLSRIQSVISLLTSAANTYLGLSIEQQADTDLKAYVPLVGLAIGMVGALFRVQLRSPSDHIIRSWLAGFCREITGPATWSVINGVTRFFGNIVELFQRVLYWGLGYVDPSAESLRLLSERNTMFCEYIDSAVKVVNPVNKDYYTRTTTGRLELMRVLSSTYQVLAVLSRLETIEVVLSVRMLCTKVIKFCEDNHSVYMSSPVRYEPYIIFLEGPPGVGKSYVADWLATSILKSIGYRSTGAATTFVRSPGVKYWNGYAGQPVIIYDDFLNMNEKTMAAEQISELYQLKSPSPMNLNMAALDDKSTMAEPLLVICCTNNAFIDGALVYNSQAFLRRRDIILNLQSSEADIRQTLQSDQVRPNFDHIRVKRYNDVKDRSSTSPKAIPFADGVKYCVESFGRYHAQELINVRMRITQLNEGLSQDASRVLNIGDPISMFMRNVMRVDDDLPERVPSEILSQQVHTILQQIAGNDEIVSPVIHIPGVPNDPFQQSDVNWEQLLETLVCLRGGGGAIGPLGVYPEMLAPHVTAFCDWLKESRYRVEELVRQTQSAECCVCMVERSVFARCASNVPHPVCVACYAGIRRTNNVVCPVCRNNNLSPAVEEMNIIPTIMVWVAKAGITSASLATQIALTALRYVTRKNDIEMYKILILGLGYALGDCAMSFSWFGLSIAAGIATSVHFAGMYLSPSTTNFFHYIRGSRFFFKEVSIILKDFFNIFRSNAQADGDMWMDEEWFASVVEPAASPAGCLHHHLVPDGTSALAVTYSAAGRCFMMTPDLGAAMIRIPDHPCQGPECVWEDPTVWRRYMQVWGHPRRASIAGCVLDEDGRFPVVLLTPDQRPVVRVEWHTRMLEWVREHMPTRVTFLNLVRPFLSMKVFLVATTIMTAGTVWAKFAQIKSFIFGFFSVADQTEQLISSGSSVTRHLPRTAHSLRAASQSVDEYVSSQSDQNFVGVLSKILSNFVIISVKGLSYVQRMQAVGVYGYTMLMPEHYIRMIQASGSQVVLQRANQLFFRVECELDMTTVKKIDGTDLVYVSVPTRFNQFRDIRSHFAMKADFASPMETRAMVLDMGTFRSESVIVPMLHSIKIASYVATANYASAECGTDIVIHNAFLYNYGRSGACGALIIRPGGNRPILAMHVAGTSKYNNPYDNTGIGAVVFQEDCPKAIKPVSNYTTSGKPVQPNTIMFPDESVVQVHGCVEPSQVPFMPSSSKIVRSVISDVLEQQSTTEPACLSSRDERWLHEMSPLVSGCAKHGLQVRPFSVSDMHIVRSMLHAHMVNTIKPSVIRVERRSIDVAVCGVKDLEFYDPLDLSTSAGYPFNLVPNHQLKSSWIEVQRDHDMYPCDPVINVRLTEVMEAKNEQRKNGVRPITIFEDFLKDERRKPEKLRALGGTRIICMSPMDLTIEMRRYFLDFTSAFMACRGQDMGMVGISVDGPEWTILAMELMAKGNNIITIDYKDFGPAFMRESAEMFFDEMISWNMSNGHFDDADLQVMMVLKEELLASDHLCHNLLYRQNCGAPSGSSVTTIVNSGVHIVYIFSAFVHLLRAQMSGIMPTLEYFNKHVALRVYGDDGIMSVSSDILPWFNGCTIHDFFKEYGIVSTSAEKTSQVPCVPLRDAVFLKRRFARHPDGSNYLAPLEWSSVVDCAHWTWRTASEEEATIENAHASVLLAYGHGRKKFERWKKEVNLALASKDLRITSLTWDAINGIFFGSEQAFENRLALYNVGDPMRTPVGFPEENTRTLLLYMDMEELYHKKTEQVPEEVFSGTSERVVFIPAK